MPPKRPYLCFSKLKSPHMGIFGLAAVESQNEVRWLGRRAGRAPFWTFPLLPGKLSDATLKPLLSSWIHSSAGAPTSPLPRPVPPPSIFMVHPSWPSGILQSRDMLHAGPDSMPIRYPKSLSEGTGNTELSTWPLCPALEAYPRTRPVVQYLAFCNGLTASFHAKRCHS